MGLTPAELWEKDPEQVDLMVAFLEVEHDAGPHGVPMSEATDARANPQYVGDGARRYTTKFVPDWAQFSINTEMKRLQEASPNADYSHYRPVVSRVDY